MPSSFWKAGVVHDLVQLQRNQVIDLRDARVDHHLGVARDGHGAIENCATNSLTRFCPRSLDAGSDAEAAFFDDLVEQTLLDYLFGCGRRCCSGCLCFSHWIPSLAHFALQLVQLFRVADGVEQQFFQLVVALQAAAQIRETRAQVQQFLERLDLAGHVLGLEVVHALEIQVDLEIGRIGIVAELVFDRERQMRLHALEDGIEVVGIDLDEFPVLQLGQGFGRADR